MFLNLGAGFVRSPVRIDVMVKGERASRRERERERENEKKRKETKGALKVYQPLSPFLDVLLSTFRLGDVMYVFLLMGYERVDGRERERERERRRESDERRSEKM